MVAERARHVLQQAQLAAFLQQQRPAAQTIVAAAQHNRLWRPSMVAERGDRVLQQAQTAAPPAAAPCSNSDWQRRHNTTGFGGLER
jgi:hypothetical protein